MTLVVNKLNGCGLSNNARRERLPKKTYVGNMVLATELPGSSNKSQCFLYKGEWVNAHYKGEWVMHLKVG